MKYSYLKAYDYMLNASHTLIAGTTGSGKSVALAGLIHRISIDSPRLKQIVLIDPKRVELNRYRRLPHCIDYAASYADIEQCIAYYHSLMLQRYQEMEYQGVREYAGADIYILIDEFVDLKLFCSKETMRYINHIASLARASKIHLVICTQRPTKDTLTPLLKDNLPCKLALATESPQQSKYLTGSDMAYGLPIGTGQFYNPSTPGQWTTVKIPMVSEDVWQEVFAYWGQTTATRPGFLKRFASFLTR